MTSRLIPRCCRMAFPLMAIMIMKAWLLLLFTPCVSAAADAEEFSDSGDGILQRDDLGSDSALNDYQMKIDGKTVPDWYAAMTRIKNMTASEGTPRTHPEGWEEARSEMFAQIPLSNCRFPSFYFRNMKYYDNALDGSGSYGTEIHWRARLREQFMSKKAHRMNAKYDGRDAPPKPLDADGPELTRKISFLHIGEAGGTELACSIREARKYGVRRHCGRGARARFNHDEYDETAISRQVSCYSHFNYNGNCLDASKFTSYLINVRNPIERIKSWFVQEHFLNEQISHPEFSKDTLHCGALMLGTCYKDFDHLTSVGLSPPRDITSKLPIRKDLSPDECAHWAWSAIEGFIPATYHNHFNYEWFLRPLLEAGVNIGVNKELFVIRAEYMEDDWRTMDRMVGGTGETVPNDLIDGSLPYESITHKHLLITNTTLSEVGATNLCRVMCRELQVYKLLLRRAANIDEAGFKQSMQELNQVCPEEPWDTPRRCEYY